MNLHFPAANSSFFSYYFIVDAAGSSDDDSSVFEEENSSSLEFHHHSSKNIPSNAPLPGVSKKPELRSPGMEVIYIIAISLYSALNYCLCKETI